MLKFFGLFRLFSLTSAQMFAKMSEIGDDDMKKSKRVAAIVAVVICTAAAVSAVLLYSYIKTNNSYKNAPLALPENFTVTGHTGCMGEKDNSIEAMEAAVKAGAQIVEFDLNFDENKNPVLSHDAPKGNEVTLEQAFEFLQSNSSVLANVDAKSTENLKEVNALAEKYMVKKQIFFTGIEEEDVEAVKVGCPGVPYYLNVDVNKRKASDTAYLEEIALKIIACGAVGINMHKRAVTKELCDFFHSRGMLVSVYTVDGYNEIYRVLAAAPDNITSRNPDRVLSIIAEKSK